MNNIFLESISSDTIITYSAGTRATGTILEATPSRILVDLPGGCTGIITKKELSAYDDEAVFKVGEVIEAAVIDEYDEDGLVVLSLKRASQDTVWAEMGKLLEDETIIKVKISEANKGGLMAKYKGLKAFLPVSQLTPEHYPRLGNASGAAIQVKLEELLGQELVVRVITVNRPEEKLIVSEKAAYSDKAKETLKYMNVGDVLKGKVSGVVKYGIFIEYNGIEGLVHLSEISWEHVADPHKLYTLGDEVEFMILSLDTDKLSFSIKRLQEDPWVKAIEPYNIGQIVSGEVMRWNDKGVFVRITDDIIGLIPLSDFGVDDYQDLKLREGQEIKSKIMAVNTESRRFELERSTQEEAAKEA